MISKIIKPEPLPSFFNHKPSGSWCHTPKKWKHLDENPNLFLYLCINQWNFDSTNVENPKEKSFDDRFFSSVFEPLRRLEINLLIPKIFTKIPGLFDKQPWFLGLDPFIKLYRLNCLNMLINRYLKLIRRVNSRFFPVIHMDLTSFRLLCGLYKAPFFSFN